MNFPAPIKDLFSKPQKKPDSIASDTHTKSGTKKKKVILYVMVTFFLFIVLIVLWKILVPSNKAASSSTTTYTSDTVTKRDITQSISATGTLSAGETYTVTSTVSGEVTYASFSEGDKVTKGQTLYVISNKELNTSISQAKSSVSAAKSAYKSALSQVANLNVKAGASSSIASIDVMVGDKVVAGAKVATLSSGAGVYSKAEGTVSQIKFSVGDSVSSSSVVVVLTNSELSSRVDSAYSSYENAQNELSKLNSQLDNYTIKAPISGTVVDKTLKKGETAENGRQLCIVYDLSYLSVSLNVDELDILSVKKGQSVTLSADATEGVSYSGVVSKVSVVGTTASGVTSYPVAVKITKMGELLPGMNVSAVIEVVSKEDVLSIPVAAVVRGNKVLAPTTDASESVDGAPEGYKYVEVTLGSTDGDYIEVTQGLSDGDTIAIPVTVNETTEDSGGFFENLFNGGGSKGGSAPSGSDMQQMPSGGSPSGDMPTPPSGGNK